MAAEFEGEIKGYPEFMRAIADINKRLPESMREAATAIAREWVSLAQSAAGTPQQALAARELMVDQDAIGASIRNDSPLFFGAEFGGQGRPETMHFPPYQGKRGYFLFPTARSNAERFNDMWSTAIDEGMSAWDHKER